MLDEFHLPNYVQYTDKFPMAIFNIAGQLRRKVPTLMASGEFTFSYRSGGALVYDILTNLLVNPNIEEKEKIVGLKAGS